MICCKNVKIILTGGGSGGHTMPAVAMIKTLKKYFNTINASLEIIYIGSRNGIEKEIIKKEGIKYIAILTGKLRRYFSIKNIFDLFNIVIGLVQSFFIIKKIKPSLLFSTGGFVSVPPVIAAFLNRVPIVIHEQTIDAGLANKIASSFATKIALTFNESSKYFNKNKSILTGIPLRDELFESTKEKAFLKFNFDKDKPVIYFTGGGLGCHILNISALEILDKLLEKTNIIFQTGKLKEDYENFLKLKEDLDSDKKRRFVLFDFINEELADVYAISDLAIARSGAGTVNELTTFKIPAIFIPLAIATNDEQRKNAMTMAEKGGAIIISEDKLNSKVLLDTIFDIILTDKLDIMKKSLKSINFERGNEKILAIFKEILNIEK